MNALPRVRAALFGVVLGLAGLASDWRLAHVAWSLPAAVGEVIYAIAFVARLTIATLYALKWSLLRLSRRKKPRPRCNAASSALPVSRRCSWPWEPCRTRAPRPSRCLRQAPRSQWGSACGAPEFSGAAIAIPRRRHRCSTCRWSQEDSSSGSCRRRSVGANYLSINGDHVDTALAGATQRLSLEGQAPALALLAPILFVVANVIVLVSVAGTLWLLLKGKLLTPALPPAATTSGS